MKLKVEKIKLLKEYFKKKSEVLVAFIFGSQAEDLERECSDWDIAIYLHKRNLKKENKIWSDLVDILDKEVDLVCLNEAPAILASRIIREGIPLKIKDRKFFLDYLLKITEEAEYFIKFSEDYYKIYQRTKSLTQTDKVRLRKILIFLENSLKEFGKFKKMTFDEYAKNLDKRRNIERWVENLMNSVLDISKIILAATKRPLPDTYKKIVLEMSFLINFNKNAQEKFLEWVELRIIAHEYLEILWERINYFLKTAHPYLKNFLNKVKKFVE